MLHADREALLCDFAETYHIYDLRALPVLTTAALAVGLRGNSRIKMKLMGLKYIPPIVLESAIADKLSMIYYYFTADKATPEPLLFRDVITGEIDKRETAKGFDTIEDFEAARAEFFNEG